MQLEISRNNQTVLITRGQHGNNAGQLGYLAVRRSSTPTTSTARDALNATETTLNDLQANLVNLRHALDTLTINELIKKEPQSTDLY